MSKQTCSRTWEAEAIEDGRLDGADVASFGRHVATCPSCSLEARALASLRSRMGAVDAPPLNDFALQRMRGRVLERAGASQTRGRRPRAARVGLAFAMATVLIALGLHYARGHGAAPVLADPSAVRFDVAGPSVAAVTSSVEPGLTRASVADGETSFHVEHVGPGRRFLLALPDGEIEVRGTRFTVNVAERHTRRVAVTEGVVSLRLEGQPERSLRAGDTWTPAEPSAAEAAALRPSAAEAATLGLAVAPVATASIASARPSTPAASRSARPPADRALGAQPRHPVPATRPAPAPAPKAERSGAATAASRRFADAMANFQRANYAQADALLGAFARDFPDDTRAEDAAFLRAVARSREGDVEGAAALAREYLDRFPQGLRRPEAEDLLRARRP